MKLSKCKYALVEGIQVAIEQICSSNMLGSKCLEQLANRKHKLV